jgi:hypothetical protein
VVRAIIFILGPLLSLSALASLAQAQALPAANSATTQRLLIEGQLASIQNLPLGPRYTKLSIATSLQRRGITKQRLVYACLHSRCSPRSRARIVPTNVSLSVGDSISVRAKRRGKSLYASRVVVRERKAPLPPPGDTPNPTSPVPSNPDPTFPEPQPSATPVVPEPTPEPKPGPVTSIVLPIEVMGQDGSQVSKTLSLSASEAAAAHKLYFRIHGLTYADKVGITINSGREILVSNESVEVESSALRYGGIGGGYATIKIYIPAASQRLVEGENSFTFRFNFTDGISSGFRVTEINLLDANGRALIQDQRIVKEDPSQWRPQLSMPSDIQAGEALWRSAPLTDPMTGGPMKAKCQHCHVDDGMDLKYFNFSDYSIVARSKFHGLSERQGQQIAAYIRSLPGVAPGRPWDPPYQPGPGIDARPVAEWAAGAGVDAVLERDEQMFAYMFPKGIRVDEVRPEANMKAREIPVPFQFPDWNAWLPTVHPIDGFGEGSVAGVLADDCESTSDLLQRGVHCATKSIHTRLNTLAKQRPLTLNDLWRNSLFQAMGLYTGTATSGALPPPPSDQPWSAMEAHREFSLRQLIMVKNFELHRRYELEGTLPTALDPTLRRWVGAYAFMTSPVMVGLPKQGFHLRNGTKEYHEYLGFIWYHLQLVLNDGNRNQSANSPIDWGYSFAHLKDLLNYSKQGGMGMLTLWYAKGLQLKNETTPADGTSRFGLRSGFPYLTSPPFMQLQYNLDPVTHARVVDVLMRALVDYLASYPNEVYFDSERGREIALPLAPGSDDSKIATKLWVAIPIAREYGVSSETLERMIAFGKRMFPAPAGHSWDDLRTVSCRNAGKADQVRSRYYLTCESEQVLRNLPDENV